MRYLLGLVVKSAPAQPARDVAAYALEEQLDDAPEHAAPQPPATVAANAAPAPAVRAALAGDAPRAARDERSNARDARDEPDARDAGDALLRTRDAEVVAEPARLRPAAPVAASADDATRAGARPRGDEPVPEYTRERVVVERTLERTTHVERVEHATTILRPAASVAATAPVVSAAARRAVPFAPAAAPPAGAPRVPDVTIAIGTIELRGAGAPAAAPPPRAQRPRLSLDEYLASRNGAR